MMTIGGRLSRPGERIHFKAVFGRKLFQVLEEKGLNFKVCFLQVF